jgi:DNA-binding transcriptional LysR family regulator
VFSIWRRRLRRGQSRLAVASIWMCTEELASSALVELLTEYTLDPMTAFVVFPVGRRPSQKARVFADYLEQAVTQSRISSLEPPIGLKPPIGSARG